MKSKKKIIFNGVFLAVVFALTIYGVFHGEDLSSMMDAIHRADKRWLVPGITLVAFFIWGESIIIWYMMRSSGIHLKKRSCFLFSSVGFFFSCITPSASGGQPMQIYYMKKEKISIPVSTVILMIVTITYKLVLVVIWKVWKTDPKRVETIHAFVLSDDVVFLVLYPLSNRRLPTLL